MKIVIPIAGRGSKFISAGYDKPKPLITIKEKPMIKWATDAVNFLNFDENLIFIVLEEHVKNFNLDHELRKIYGEKVKIIISEGFTEGAACTVLLATEFINNEEELIIYNADQFFVSSIEKEMQKKNLNIKGIIPVFRATNSKWSYVLLDDDGYVKKAVEKETISNFATVGFYYFSQGKDFVWGAKEMIRKNLRVQGEFYVCPVYNELIQRGDKILAFEVQEMWSLGTPEDVDYFKKYFRN